MDQQPSPSSSKTLARLSQVDVRNIWTTEAGDFTPWLAREENLALLGDTVGIELELEATEKDVGPFRADILCKDTATGHWVLIENQLARTDHTHLGQLLTYAAGLKAVTIIWIADRFTEEHRAALDWLNEITDDRFNFFGLEIELWRIADSPVAPKFNMISKPNDWTKTIGSAANRIDENDLTDTKLLQQEYWAALRELLLDRKGPVKPQKPLPQHWANFAVGRSNFSLHALVNTQRQVIAANLSCYGDDAKPHFYMLTDDKEAIEREMGQPLVWEELPNKKVSRISLERPADPTNKTDWPTQHEWLADTLERLHRVFAPRVKTLNAKEYEPRNGQPQAIEARSPLDSP